MTLSGPASILRGNTVGLSDRAILELNLVVSYFAYANRIADGLGVQLEPDRDG